MRAVLQVPVLPFRSFHCLQRHIHVAAFWLLWGGRAGVVGHRSAASCRILEAHEQADLAKEVGMCIVILIVRVFKKALISLVRPRGIAFKRNIGNTVLRYVVL